MEIDLALLADAATVDAAGKLNILGVFDRISAAGFPARHPRISLILRFNAPVKEAGHHKAEIVLRDPEGAEVVRMNGDIPVGIVPPGADGRFQIPQVVNMDRLEFPRPGRYTFEVMVDGELHVTVPLFLHDATPQGPMAKA
jgi:hypothetical protein